VQEHGCRVLKELGAFNPLNQQRIVECGGIACILQVMKIHIAESTVQELVCGVLRNITASNAICQNEIVSRGGVILILDAMTKFEAAVNVQWACCWLLFCLALHNPESRSIMCSQGVLHAVLSTMRMHRDTPRVQEACCWFLKEMSPNIVIHTHQGMLPACIQGLLKTIERCAEHKVQSAASAALRQLSVHDATGNVKTISLGRCGRLGCNSTKRVLSVIEE